MPCRRMQAVAAMFCHERLGAVRLPLIEPRVELDSARVMRMPAVAADLLYTVYHKSA